jgi:hypothetical protein
MWVQEQTHKTTCIEKRANYTHTCSVDDKIKR